MVYELHLGNLGRRGLEIAYLALFGLLILETYAQITSSDWTVITPATVTLTVMLLLISGTVYLIEDRPATKKEEEN